MEELDIDVWKSEMMEVVQKGIEGEIDFETIRQFLQEMTLWLAPDDTQYELILREVGNA